MVDSDMQKNIEQQLERLLSQLSDIDEVQNSDEISPEELEELKQETVEQIAEFERFLARVLEQNAQLESAKSAQARIDAAKVKLLGVSDAKKAFESNQSDGLRERLATLQSDHANKHVTAEAFRQQAIALIMQLEKCTTLKQNELSLKQSIQHHGQTAIAAAAGGNEISGSAANVIQAASSFQINSYK